MADEKIEIDLDPAKVLAAMELISTETKKLAESIETALGKEAPKSIGKMEEAAENGTTKISTYFRNLGTRIKEDMKTAFDIGKVMSGLKITTGMAEGVKQVLDMEKAFDKLNTRLHLTGKTYMDFKNSVGSNAAGAGQKVEDILPGVETVAAKGNVTSPAQLSEISKTLAEARAVTGEDTSGLADSIVEILISQGKKITAQSFKSTMDAVQGTRVAGAFGSAGDAASAIETILKGLNTQQQKSMGIGSREAGGLAAMASKAGAGGNDILNTILKMGATPKGQNLANAVFGAKIFNKEGKFDAAAFQNVNKQGFGQYTAQTRAGALGADQADLSRFIDVMKDNLSTLGDVTKGADEAGAQFGEASNNMSTKIDKFKEGTKAAGRKIGYSLSQLGNTILNGHGDLKGDLKGVGKSMWDNKGSLMGAMGLAAGGAVLMGSGAKGLMNKVPGLRGLAGGLAGGELAKAAGITPVYVTNAAEIASGGVVGKGLGGLLGGTGGKLAGMAGVAGMWGGGALAAGAVGYGVGSIANMGIDKLTGGKGLGGEIYDLMHPDEMKAGQGNSMPPGINPDDIREAIKAGMIDGHKAVRVQPTYTNPSKMPPTGANH